MYGRFLINSSKQLQAPSPQQSLADSTRVSTQREATGGTATKKEEAPAPFSFSACCHCSLSIHYSSPQTPLRGDGAQKASRNWARWRSSRFSAGPAQTVPPLVCFSSRERPQTREWGNGMQKEQLDRSRKKERTPPRNSGKVLDQLGYLWNLTDYASIFSLHDKPVGIQAADRHHQRAVVTPLAIWRNKVPVKNKARHLSTATIFALHSEKRMSLVRLFCKNNSECKKEGKKERKGGESTAFCGNAEGMSHLHLQTLLVEIQTSSSSFA